MYGIILDMICTVTLPTYTIYYIYKTYRNNRNKMEIKSQIQIPFQNPNPNPRSGINQSGIWNESQNPNKK